MKLSVPYKEFAIHLFLLICVYKLFLHFSYATVTPSNHSLIQWDVAWYQSIINNGYVFTEGKQCNVAFFPLFPYMWKWLNVTAVGMSLINLVLMLTGFTVLKHAFKFDSRTLLLLMSVPGMFFCYIPYSEALFFLSSSVLLYGLQKKQPALTAIAVAVACLTRSTSFVFIPCILFTWLCNYSPRKNKTNALKPLLLIAVAIAAWLLVEYIHGRATGYYFKLFEVQKTWHRELQWPQFFISTWDRQRMVWFESIAFFTGAACAVWCFYFLYLKYKRHTKNFNPAFLFSISYLSAITALMLFYSPLNDDGSTSLFSLNRFVFASPFLSVFLIMVARYLKLNYSLAFWFLALVNITGFSFGAFTCWSNLIYFGMVTLYVTLWLLMIYQPIKREIWAGVYFLNLILQVYLFNSFLNGYWVA